MTKTHALARAALLALAVPAAAGLALMTVAFYRGLPSGLGITSTWERGLLCGTPASAIAALTFYAFVNYTPRTPKEGDNTHE